MNKIISLKALIAISVTLIFLQGCIATNPTPSALRDGDVTQVLLGGIKRNADGQFIAPSDITATITDSGLNVYPLRVETVFRAYPDTFSKIAIGKGRDGIYNPFEPNDGAYWATIWLADSNGDPLGLLAGEGTISITSAKLTQTNDFDPSVEGTLAAQGVTILPGIGGDRAQEELAGFDQYTIPSNGYVEIKPTPATDLTDVHGGQIKFTYNDADAFNNAVLVATVSQDKNINLIQKVEDGPGAGEKTITAYFTNPRGFVPSASWTPGQSTHKDLIFGLQAQGLESNVGNISIDATESFLIDSNGDQIPSSAFTIENPALPAP